jgi:hypothetical protein
VLAFRTKVLRMAPARGKVPGGGANRRPLAPGPGRPGAKLAVTLRLHPDRARALQAVAAAENRTLTNYVETVLIRDLSRRDEATRVIVMRAAPGTSARIAPEDVARGEGESATADAGRQALLAELWAIPDRD